MADTDAVSRLRDPEPPTPMPDPGGPVPGPELTPPNPDPGGPAPLD